MMQSHGFVSMINKPTRRTVTSASCLDHYFVKCREKYFNQIDTAILEHDLTDHSPILFSMQTERTIYEYNKSTSYQKKKSRKIKELFEGGSVE